MTIPSSASASDQLTELQAGGSVSVEAALAFFDRLEPVDLDFMLGRWQGAEFPTNHPMDGLLELANWYGKEFVSPDCVHPLLMRNARQHIYKMVPNSLMFKLTQQISLPRGRAWQPIYTWLNTLFKTNASQARLRLMEYRGKVSATMIYDALPINDIFRKVDESTVFGLMDYKHSEQPFFFLLRRDTAEER
jgi:hypothetical protein